MRTGFKARCLETTPHNSTHKDMARFTHLTSCGEWGPWSSVEIQKKICSEQCHAKGGSQVSSEQFPTGRAETTGTNPQHAEKPFQEV